jgi:hypothetical protein
MREIFPTQSLGDLSILGLACGWHLPFLSLCPDFAGTNKQQFLLHPYSTLILRALKDHVYPS